MAIKKPKKPIFPKHIPPIIKYYPGRGQCIYVLKSNFINMSTATAIVLADPTARIINAKTKRDITWDVINRTLPRIIGSLSNKRSLLREIVSLLVTKGKYTNGRMVSEVLIELAQKMEDINESIRLAKYNK